MNSKLLRQLSIIKPISHRPSRLDLIDDTTLTSLPLPPPMKSKRRKKGNGITKNSKFTEDSTLVNHNDVNLVEDSEISELFDDDTKDQDDDLIDESYQEGDETEDPIVLVEDYIYRNTSDFERLHRKKSLATFKEKLHEDVGHFKTDILPYTTQDTSGTLRSSLLDFETSSRSESEVSCTLSRPSIGLVFMHLLNQLNLHRSCLEEVEGVFGKIPGTESLNYCELCDKPLYELSALINKRNENRENFSYKEFICWECIESYEMYSREFPNCPLKEQHLAKVTKIFKEIETKYLANADKTNDVVRITKPNDISPDRKFSDPLLQQLRELHSQSNGESFVWLKSIPDLLKWRWRILFPEAAQLQ